MTFRKTVLAYLTGWVIAQAFYNRLLKYMRKREAENPSEEAHAFWREQARHVVDELIARETQADFERRHGSPIGENGMEMESERRFRMGR